MKILHIIPSLRKGGAERIVLDICIELQNRTGIEVCLVSLSPLCEYADLASQVNIKIIPSRFIPSITGKSVKDVEGLNAFINAFQPDVVHTHLWEAEIVARQVDYDRGVWVTHFHDNMRQMSKLTWPLTKQKLTDWYERLLIIKEYKRRDSHFVCISKHCLRFAKEVLPSHFEKSLTLLPNAINYGRFANTDVLKDETVLKLVSIGSLVSKKNHSFLLDIADCLRSKGVNFIVQILGDGQLRNSLEEKILNRNLSNQVSLLGRIDTPEQILQDSHIYIHPAVYEPFGLVILEAMSAGLPVVTLNGGGNADIMENGKNGYLFDEQDPQKFADQIIQLWQDKTLYNSISEYASEYAKRYDIKEYVSKLLSLYAKETV